MDFSQNEQIKFPFPPFDFCFWFLEVVCVYTWCLIACQVGKGDRGSGGGE